MKNRLVRVSLSMIAALSLLLGGNVLATAHPSDTPDEGKSALLGKDLDELNRAATQPLGSAECENGTAAGFPCKNVDLESFVPLEQLGGGTGNDVWGWTDPRSGAEYAIMGTSNGTAFVDVSQPENPVVVGQMPTRSAAGLPLWRDIKVHGNHAYVVSEHDDHGMQVFDLTRLRNASPKPAVFTPDAVYDRFAHAHNVSVNPDTGFAYAVGTGTCNGGLHMIDINSPENPAFAGCFSADGYTHDVQCETYSGPDGRFHGREICFASNEDTVTIVDVTDKTNPRMLSRTTYPTAAYTHQGALTADQGWFLFGDELDESEGKVHKTTTYIMRVRSLTDPATPVAHHHGTPSIDHNLHVEDGYVHESNYTAGLRILDFNRQSLRRGQLTEVAFFDVFPANNAEEYAGTWGNYASFDSGIVVVSSIDSGLFLLRPQLDNSPGNSNVAA